MLLFGSDVYCSYTRSVQVHATRLFCVVVLTIITIIQMAGIHAACHSHVHVNTGLESVNITFTLCDFDVKLSQANTCGVDVAVTLLPCHCKHTACLFS
jgi:hypothetical protein